MKKYVKPAIEGFDMSPVSILEGSVKVKAKAAISSFRTDDADWETTSSGTKKYNFWDE